MACKALHHDKAVGIPSSSRIARGRGSRALLEWYKHGALVHDASYCTCVELEGLEISLLSVLKMVSVPLSETKHDGVCPVLLGTICGNATLHYGASSAPQAIAPVTYMWRPPFNSERFVLMCTVIVKDVMTQIAVRIILVLGKYGYGYMLLPLMKVLRL